MTRPSADIGVIGLAVMGRNLILNMNDNGFTVVAYNRTTDRVDEFIAGEARGTRVIGAHSLEELVASIRRPRKVMLMIKAGSAVDAAVESLVPLLDEGDIVIDGGNSLFVDSNRRAEALERKGILFVGAGVSGGEEGARRGPSIMPGGSTAAWPHVQPILQSIAADVDGEPCCSWIGPGGSGHYVKMVHNGIEYGDMQVIAEAYDLMRRGLGMEAGAMQRVFAEWNAGKLDSFLIEITAAILGFADEDGSPLIDRILDAAGQKGTGKWTVVSSMDLGMPVTLVAEAVYARITSSLLEDRAVASGTLDGPVPAITDDRDGVIADLHDALYASKIISYAQGFMLMDAAGADHGWDLDFAAIASMWRGGCVIRARYLGDVMRAYRDDPDLRNLLLSPFFSHELEAAQGGLRRTVTRAIAAGVPVPAYSSALAFYDAFRSERLPANMIQAQRDFFGAHTYERIDRPRGEFFHTNWTGTGGEVSSTTYTV